MWMLSLAALSAILFRASGVGTGTEIAGGWQFRTAADLGAGPCAKMVELPRRLPRVAMETLAIVAYHQPVTRSEIEEIRGATLSQNTLDLLLENGLVTSKRTQGNAQAGQPLWGTTPAFPGAVRAQRSARPAEARGIADRPQSGPGAGGADSTKRAGGADVTKRAGGADSTKRAGGADIHANEPEALMPQNTPEARGRSMTVRITRQSLLDGTMLERIRATTTPKSYPDMAYAYRGGNGSFAGQKPWPNMTKTEMIFTCSVMAR